MRRAAAMAIVALLSAAASARGQDVPLVVDNDKVPTPKRVKFVPPEYPADAQARGLRGIVILELTIDASGKVTDVGFVRSIPGLDEAAAAAARQWVYEPVKINGKPVAVRLTVPITFLMKLPDFSRGPGIPELRAGAAPAWPNGAQAKGSSTVVAELTLEPDGQVAEATIVSGNSPFSEALLQAIRSWSFQPDNQPGALSFRVQAEFVLGERGEKPRVSLALSGLRRSEPQATPAAAPAAAPPAAAAPSEPAPPKAEAPASEKPAAKPVDAAPLPAPPKAEATPAPVPVTPRPLSSAPAARREPRSAPATEVLRAPAAGPPPNAGPVSAVRDVALEAGMPDLTKGRRPVVPPLARLGRVGGSVTVRFSIDAAGATTVQDVQGPDLLKPAAQEMVASWGFRRVSAERLFALATVTYRDETASASIRLDAQP